jgi:MFS family permease
MPAMRPEPSNRNPGPGAPARERAMRLSLVDASTYALMLGLGESYFLADAVRLGASSLQKGLVLGLPLCLGTLGPLLALRLMRVLRIRKPLVLVAAFLQSVTLAAMAALDGFERMTPSVLIGLAAVYQVCGQAAGTAWNSWYGDLVPEQRRARYFALRNRCAHGATFVGLLAAGLLLHWREPATTVGPGSSGLGGAGFGIIFGLASCFRLVSFGLLAASPEPRFRGLAGRVRAMRFLATGRGTSAWRLVALVALLQYAVYTASPWFHPYMLEQLEFTYLEFMSASLIIVAAKVAAAPLWGTAVDRFGSRGVFVLCVFCLSLVPLPWIWVGGLGGVLVAQTLSGLSWSGYELSNFTMMLGATYRQTRPAVFAAQSVMNGTAQLLGSLTGAALLQGVGLSVVTLFAVSAAARLCVAFSLPALLPDAERLQAARVRRLELRVLGIRPNGGIVHRAVEGMEPEELGEGDEPSDSAGTARP